MKKCPNDGNPLILDSHDMKQARVRCPVCRYELNLFRLDNGKWETQEERRRRMNNYRICGDCGGEYQEHEHCGKTSDAEILKGICPTCAAPILQGRKSWQRYHNTEVARSCLNGNSPWRIGIRPALDMQEQEAL